MGILVALAPVLVFLALLIAMDSFKLVHPRGVMLALAAGAIVALACNALQGYLLASHVPLRLFTRYVSPPVEETAKALFIVALVRSGRIGFLVDAAVVGFAVGTGFAVVENVTYLMAMTDASLLTWTIRGLGTAMLHGAATAIFAMLLKALADRHPGRLLVAALPGWTAAVLIHSAFNHLLLPPIAAAALLLLVMPILLVVVFERSERATREWVNAGLDLDLQLLDLVQSDAFTVTRFGAYLQTLRQRFPGPVVADMFCLLRLELELSIQAKAFLMAREAGLAIAADADLPAVIAEIAYLNDSIGMTGRLALEPLHVSTHRDRWHRHLLMQS